MSIIQRLSAGTAVLALSAAVALPAAAQDDPLTADSVVASVNGVEITLGHVLVVRASLPEDIQNLPTDVLWNGILDQIIGQEVLSQSDLARETRTVTLALENERRSLLATTALRVLIDEAATEDALRAAYEELYATADLGVEYNAAHILVETREEAASLVEELEAGADFAALAREHSTGPSGPNGGALGWFGPGTMVAPFQEAVEAMSPGDISAPVETQFGWHVIRLNETRVPDTPSLDDVRDALVEKVQREAVDAYIAQARDAADITMIEESAIDTSILNDLGILEE
jgi:peptidyl-prolyl cis-trans isomerase C